MFSKPSVPNSPAAPPPPPTVATVQSDSIAQQQQARLARGATANMLTGGQGLASLGNTSKTLLGQ
jgi:hypothetical protein